jgi:sulfite exporter TauE/SafE
MFEVQSITTLGAALTAGLVTSVHCAGMCGPLSCTLLCPKANTSIAAGKLAPKQSRWAAFAAYHAGRVASYSTLGLLSGLLGTQVAEALRLPQLRLIPLLLAVVILVTVFRLDRFLPKPTWLARLNQTLARQALALPQLSKGATLGALTPLIPCGPLYLMLVVALFSGSALRGALYLLVYALGTIPLLTLAQGSWIKLTLAHQAQWVRTGQWALASLAIIAILWRTSHAEALWEQVCGPLGL